MSQSYWHKQGEKPLFPDLLWARPEVKRAAGKLLVVGGHAQSFAVPAEAYAAAERAGVGALRVILPDSLEKTVSTLFPAAVFAPSNPSGGFASHALAEILAAAQWADGILLAGDTGRNSESLAMLENLASKHTGRLTITRDIADFFCAQPQVLLQRASRRPKIGNKSTVTAGTRTEEKLHAFTKDDSGTTLLVLSMGQLQRLGQSLKLPYAFTSDLGLVQLIERLHKMTLDHPKLFLITRQLDQYIVAVDGEIATTPVQPADSAWRTSIAASAATWWLQTPTKPFEALACSVLHKTSY